MMTKFMNKQRGLLAAIMALVMVFAGAAFVAAEVDASGEEASFSGPTGVDSYNGTLEVALQKYAEANIDGDYTIKLLKTIDDKNYIVHQQGSTANYTKNLIIDGDNNTVKANFEIYGHAGHTAEDTVKFYNINFIRDSGDCIYQNSTESEKRYAHNVTIDSCDFELSGQAVSLRFRQCYDITVINCTVTGGHSVMWATGGTNLTISNVKSSGTGSGYSIGTVGGEVKFDTVTIDCEGHGIRAGGSVGKDKESPRNIVIEDCTINAVTPVVIRNATDAVQQNIDVKGNNTMNASNEHGLWLVAGQDEYDGGKTLPQQTGGVTVVVDDPGLSYEGVSGSGNVCYIGTGDNKTQYDSLDNAITEANKTANAVITLIQNATLGKDAELNNDVTLIIQEGVTLTIADGKVLKVGYETPASSGADGGLYVYGNITGGSIEVYGNMYLESADVRSSVIEIDGAFISVTKPKKMTVTGDSTADLGVGYGNTLVLADLNVPAGKYIEAWGTVVIEGTVTVQGNDGFHVYQGGNAQIDGALIIEGTANIDGKAIVNGSVKVYDSEGGASFNVGATGEVDVLGTMDVLKGKAKETTNTLAVTAGGDLNVEGTLTVTGTMSGMVCDMGTVVFNGAASDANTGFTVYDGVTLTIASVTGTLKITDNGIEGDDYYELNGQGLPEKKDGYYISTGNTVEITNVKNVTVSVVLDETSAKDVNNESVRLVTSEMTVTGTITSIDEKTTTVVETVTVNGASADTDKINGKAVQGTAIIGDITLGKQVQLLIGNSATPAASGTVTEDIDVVGTVNVIAEESLIVTNTCVDVTGTILVGEKTADAQMDLTVNGATYYIDNDTESDDKVTYYTTFENALAAVATAYDNEVTVLGKVKVATALEIPADATILFAEKAEMTIDVDGIVTVVVGALFDASKAEKVDVDGMLVIMDKESGLEGDNKLVYQVYTEAGEVATYSGLVLALRNAAEGDVITVVKAGEIEKSVTIPEGVTLVVPNGSTLTIGSEKDDVTLTVAGTLKVEGTVEADVTNKKVEIAVPGTIMEIGSGDIVFVDDTTGDVEIVMDDYVTFNTKIDGRATVVYSNLAYAAENATEGDVTIFGDVSAGDITFTMGEKAGEFVIGFGKTDSTMTVGTMTLVSNGKANIVLATANGAVTGTIAAAAGSVDLNKVSGITIAVSIVTDVDGTTDYMTVDETLAGSMTVATGTVTVDELSVGSTEKNVIVVETGATLVVSDELSIDEMKPSSASVEQYYALIVDGTIVFEENNSLVCTAYNYDDKNDDDKTNDVETLASEILINGTMTVSDCKIAVAGKLFVNGNIEVTESSEDKDALLTVSGAVILGTAPALGANGTMSGDVFIDTGKAFVIAYAGADVSAAEINIDNDVSKVESTEIVINGVPYMTVYTNANTDVTLGYLVTEGYLDIEGYVSGVQWEDPASATTKIGELDSVEGAKTLDTVDEVIVSAGVGLQIYVDGLKAESGMDLQFGTHTVSFAVESGYDGSAATITVNGVQVANGGTFTVDVDADKITIIASGAVPAQSGSTVVVDDADDGMALTDILLIVLVVLIVIMAIIVALRMMRS